MEHIHERLKNQLIKCKILYERNSFSNCSIGEFFSFEFEFQFHNCYFELFSESKVRELFYHIHFINFSIELGLNADLKRHFKQIIAALNFKFVEGYLHADSHKEVGYYPHGIIPYHSFYKDCLKHYAFILLDAGVEQLPKYLLNAFKSYLKNNGIRANIFLSELELKKESSLCIIKAFLNSLNFLYLNPYVERLLDYHGKYARENCILDICDIPCDVFNTSKLPFIKTILKHNVI